MTRSRRLRLIAVALFVGAMLSVSAGPPESSEDFLRLGLKALENGEQETALKHLADASKKSTDPGLIAFNQAVAYDRLFDYKEAQRHFLMALEDEAIPAERRAKASYNRGNSLVRSVRAEEKPEQRLEKYEVAIACFERCLESDASADLHKDARYNLQIAKLLWTETRALCAHKPTPNTNDPQEQQSPTPPKKNQAPEIDEMANPMKDGGTKKETKQPHDPKTDKKEPVKGETSKEAPKGKAVADPVLTPLESNRSDFDDDEKNSNAQGKSPSSIDPWKKVQEAADRLQLERQQHRKQRATLQIPSGKDW